MAKPTYAQRVQAERLPVVEGRQYRAVAVKQIDNDCFGCAARGAEHKALCDALPSCGMSARIDGKNVVYIDCGKAVPK